MVMFLRTWPLLLVLSAFVTDARIHQQLAVNPNADGNHQSHRRAGENEGAPALEEGIGTSAANGRSNGRGSDAKFFPDPDPELCADTVMCDFSELAVGVAMTDDNQKEALLESCLATLESKSVNNDSDKSPVLTILDSSFPGKTIDLGSPNVKCGGPGIGAGGAPDEEYANCEEQGQGNLLIFQGPGIPTKIPNDSLFGGIMVFTFEQPINLVDIGAMNINNGETLKIKMSAANGDEVCSFSSPDDIGVNGVWAAVMTEDLSLCIGATELEIAFPGFWSEAGFLFPGEGALTHVRFDCTS